MPVVPKPWQLNDPRVMDSTAALLLPDVPKTLLVIGGGYIGLEIGSVYAALGSKVTVVEALDGILPMADRDLVAPLEKKLRGGVRGDLHEHEGGVAGGEEGRHRRHARREGRAGLDHVRPRAGVGRPAAELRRTSGSTRPA